jgi:hypothetical protein
MVGVAGVFYFSSSPRLMGSIVRVGIFPPPHFVVPSVCAEDDIEIAITVYVQEGPSCLDREKRGIDHILGPTVPLTPIPDDRRPLFTSGKDEIVQSILVYIED